MKEIYINLMEKVLGAYKKEHIKEYVESVKINGLQEHGFPRLTANLGILIAYGKKHELKNEFLEMMDLCCKEIPIAKEKNGGNVGNDFAVKEIIFCLMEIEKSKVFGKEITDMWRAELAKIEPYKAYTVIADIPPKRIGNWAAFGAASEQLRKYAGVGDESEFIDNQIESQLFSFDHNGMYRDPNEPMVYDFVTRLQLCCALQFGYNGKHCNALKEWLMKAVDITLKMQSVTGEIPFGGRSNQFLHNEAFYAALCEFYANMLKEQGDSERAGMFKHAARIAVESIIPWIEKKPESHIKNYYPWESMYGCENYAYFDKYMITTSSWLYLAYIMSDDNIEEKTCPVYGENYICETSEFFHKVFAKFNDYAVEIDTCADNHYDSSGIGRIHKKGVPSALCLSIPFAKEPAYKLDLENRSGFSICGGIKTEDGYKYALGENAAYRLLKKNISKESAVMEFECIADDVKFNMICRITDEYVEIIAKGSGELKILFPAFEFDGEKHTELIVDDNNVGVIYEGHECRYFSDDKIIDENMVYANRNGHYKAFSVCGKDSVSLRVCIS